MPYIDWLPVIGEGLIERKPEEIARRATACLLTVQVACDLAGGGDAGQSRAFFTGLLERFGVRGELTPREREIFEGAPSEQDAVNMCWKYEAYWPLLWALGLVEELGYPCETCDCDRAIQAVSGREGFEDFMSGVRPRPPEELLNEADLIFRYNWACVDARLHGREAPAGLDAGVVFERHWGLNWLIGKGTRNDGWDSVSTDT